VFRQGRPEDVVLADGELLAFGARRLAAFVVFIGVAATPIVVQPEGRPFWVVTCDTRELFQPEDLAKLGLWKDSTIRELTREEAKLAKQRATSPSDVKAV
jgi:hypothetical protein